MGWIGRYTQFNKHHLLCFWLVVMIAAVTHAQPVDEGRVLDVRYQEGNTLSIAVQTFDTTISDATITIDGNPQALTITDTDVSADYWIVLDASISMIDVYPLVRDELLQLAQSLPDTVRLGIIPFGNDLPQLDPTTDTNAIDSWLASYQATASRACLSDGLSALETILTDPDRISYGTVIMVQVDETCDEPLPNVSIPLDMIVIGQEINATYRNLIESNNGQVILTSLLQFSASLQSLPTNDSQLSLLTIPLDDAFDTAQLDITFANGNALSQLIQAQGEFVPPATPTPVNTPTSLPTETVPPTMTTVPVATDILATDVIATDSLPTEEITATDIPLVADNSVERATIANQWIIVVATIASVFVVVVVVLRLLRSSNDDEATVTPSTDTDLSGTLITAPATEQQLAQTEIFTIREVASSLGPTHVANLINTDEDIIYEIHRPQSILGRQVGSDILIADDPQISREHVRFDTRNEDSIWLVRLTNNPILVNGIPIENTRQLDEGDIVQLSPKLQVIFVRIVEES